MADVAVAVVSWNTRDLLRACLRSLEGEDAAEVWVVDNASSDGSAEMVREEFPWVRLEARSENLGFGRAVNLVAARTDAPWIAPANADVELRPGALPALLDAGRRFPRAGILAPRLDLPSGEPQHSVYAFPTVAFTALFNLGLHRVRPALGDRMCLEGFWNPERPRDVDWAIGAFLLVRRSAWDAAGGFDDRQWMYAEDLDLGWRVAEQGFVCRYVPDAHVIHHAGAATMQAWGDERTERWLRSTYAWMLRRRGPARTRATAAINVAGAYTRAVVLRSAYHRRWGALHRRAGLGARRTLEEHR